MQAESVFISVLLTLLIFNFYYYAVNPSQTWTLIIGGLTTTLVVICTISIVGGITILGSGLSETSIRVLFGSVILFFVFFAIPTGLSTMQVGLGLGNTLINVFSQGDFIGIGTLLALALCMVGFLSGLIVIMGGS